jgi:hypothetical protein
VSKSLFLELRDLIVTPLLVMLVYAVAYKVRPHVTNQATRQYFFPALTVRIVGAIAVGLIYQFYYQGGDTFNFHTHGSRHIWEAFIDSPDKGLKLFFYSQGSDLKGIYTYASKIPFLNDNSSYAIIRIATFFDLFTFSTYSATAVCFAVIGFVGSWMLFLTFQEETTLTKYMAWATLFVPSVIFWGSGLLKDTITLSAIGFATFFTKRIFIERRFNPLHLLLLVFSLYIMYTVKKYILLCYIPSVLLWIYAKTFGNLRSMMLKIMIFPFIVILTVFSGLVAIQQVGQEDTRYALDQLGKTAQITAYDIAYQTGRDAGSTYSLGTLDGSFGNLLRLSPQAINVCLFRPYLWEVKNPLMLISALESLMLLVLTFYVLYKSGLSLTRALFSADILFCLIFSITFAFAVGVSTFNFGTLSRYKIPVLPFYSLTLIFIYNYSKRDRNNPELEATE